MRPGMKRPVRACAALYLGALIAGISADKSQAQGACGEVVTLPASRGVTISYSLAGRVEGAKAALVLLVGGGGNMNLDTRGCPRLLDRNSLVRQRSMFHDAGFVTALVDAPSDHRGEDGLGGLRLTARHADEIGKVIVDVRARTKLPVWLIGTSRGTISAVNAASRLNGAAAPEGLVLTSPVTSGRVGGYKAWVAQTVFGARLDAIRVPVLVVAHAADKCIRTPPRLAGGIVGKTGAERKQTVTVRGGSTSLPGGPSVEACQAMSAHGFAGQEKEVADGIVRFILGGTY